MVMLNAWLACAIIQIAFEGHKQKIQNYVRKYTIQFLLKIENKHVRATGYISWLHWFTRSTRFATVVMIIKCTRIVFFQG